METPTLNGIVFDTEIIPLGSEGLSFTCSIVLSCPQTSAHLQSGEASIPRICALDHFVTIAEGTLRRPLNKNLIS